MPGNARGSKRRKVDDVGLKFLDLQADVDQGETDGDEESEPEMQVFLDDDLSIPSTCTSYYLPSRLTNLSPQDEHEYLVKQADSIQRQCRRSSIAVPDPDDSDLTEKWPGNVGRNMNLWRINVRRGSERQCIDTFRQIQNTDSNGRSNLGSAIFRPSIPGIVYIEASSPDDIRRVFDRVHTAYLTQSITLVPWPERAQILMWDPSGTTVKGDWVRLRRGLYKGDVGYIAEVNTHDSTLRLLSVPRLSYHKRTGGVKISSSARPLAALFDADQARERFGVDAVQDDDGFVTFQGMKFVAGLLEHILCPQDVILDVHPTFQEINFFIQSLGWDKTAMRRWEVQDAIAAVCVLDRVEIVEGEMKGLNGTVVDKHDGTIRVQICCETNPSFHEDALLEFVAHQVRKLFKIGDYVRVRYGTHAGKSGYVVNSSIDGKLQIVQSENVNHIETNDRCSVSGCHFEASVLSVDFAEDDRQYIKPRAAHDTQSATVKCARDPKVGMRVVVVGANHFCGYHGTIQHSREDGVYGVHLDAVGRVIQFKEGCLLNISTRTPLSNPSGLPVISSSAICQPTCQSSPSTPLWNSSDSQSSGDRDSAWDPSSRTPGSGLEMPWAVEECSIVTSSQLPKQVEDESYLRSGVQKNWLAADSFHGKSIKVRFSKNVDRIVGQNEVGLGTMAYTLGTPVSGDPPVIEVRPMIPGSAVMSVPLHILEPVHPCGVKENAIIIAGEHFGKEVCIAETKQFLWCLAPSASDSPGTPLYAARREHLVMRSKFHAR